MGRYANRIFKIWSHSSLIVRTDDVYSNIMVKQIELKSIDYRFESCPPHFKRKLFCYFSKQLDQLVDRKPAKFKVGGSNPSLLKTTITNELSFLPYNMSVSLPIRTGRIKRTLYCGVEKWYLVWLITTRSGVRIPLPLLKKKNW